MDIFLFECCLLNNTKQGVGPVKLKKYPNFSKVFYVQKYLNIARTFAAFNINIDR